MCFEGQPDLKNHDPKNINSHIKIQFQDVIAEPGSIHSCDLLWQGSHCCFQFVFSIVYGVWVCVNHLFVSAFWGLEFGCVAFLHGWVFTPFLRLSGYVMYVPSCLCRACTRCIMDPWCEAASYMCMFCERRSPDAVEWTPLSMYQKGCA